MLKSSLGGLSRAEWDAMAGGHFYSSAAWLDFCSTDFGAGIDGVLGTGHGRVRVAAPITARVDPGPSSYNWNLALADRALPRLPPCGVLVGPREGYQTHLLRGGTEPSVPAVADLLDTLRIRAAAAPPAERACVAMFLTSPDVRLLHAAGVSAPPVLLEPDAWISVPAGGLPAWIEDLPKSRRVNVRREVRSFRDAGYRIEHVALAECCTGIVPLAVRTLSKYGFEARPDEEHAALRNHVTCLGEDARVALCAPDGGPPVGFCLYYHWGDTLFVRWVGFDYDRLCDAAEYFNLVYYHLIDWGAARGVRWLHLGVKSIRAKALRGARLRPLWLLDLAADSPLEAVTAQVRSGNAELYRSLAEDRSLVRGLADRADWEVGQ